MQARDYYPYIVKAGTVGLRLNDILSRQEKELSQADHENLCVGICFIIRAALTIQGKTWKLG